MTNQFIISLNLYNETTQIKIGALIEFVHHEVEIDVSEYVYKTVAEARNEADGAKLLLEGVVVSYTYNINMGKTGVYLVDSTSSIYVYGMDVANNVKIGDKIKVAGIKDYYILDKEQSNAAKFGYIGSNQLTDSQLVSVISSNNEWDKSWVEEKTVKELHETPFEEDITTNL